MITYSRIYNTVEDWLDRTDLTDRIPTFVRLAELQIYRFLRIRENESTKVYTWEDDPYNPITLPDDYKQTRLLVANGHQLERISDQRYYKLLDGYSETDQPQYFTEIDNQLYILPWPSESRTEEQWGDVNITLHYYATTALDAMGSAEDAYIYGGVMQGWLFLSGPKAPGSMESQKAKEYEDMFSKALTSLKMEHRRREYAGSTKEVSSAYGTETGTYYRGAD